MQRSLCLLKSIKVFKNKKVEELDGKARDVAFFVDMTFHWNIQNKELEAKAKHTTETFDIIKVSEVEFPF